MAQIPPLAYYYLAGLSKTGGFMESKDILGVIHRLLP